MRAARAEEQGLAGTWLVPTAGVLYEQALSQGRDPQSLDKEYVRRWLVEQGYRGEGKSPELPVEVRCEAARRYVETFELVTGTDFVPDVSEPQARLRASLGLGEA